MKMANQEIIQTAKSLWVEIKAARALLKKSQAVKVSSEKERNTYANLSSKWFDSLSKRLSSYGVQKELLDKYDTAFKGILKLSDSTNRRSSYARLFDEITESFNNDIVIFLQTDATIPEEDQPEYGDEVIKLLDRVTDDAENEYLQEALGCWKNGFLKGATVLLWCAAVDRIHRAIEKAGFERFNAASLQMKNQVSGRFKRFNKDYKVQSISDLQSISDGDILWVIEGMQLIDSNQKTRLTSCFEMRCHSGHPGSAPITKYNVISCFSDIVEIILTNPRFSIADN